MQSAGAECRCLGTGRAGRSEQRGGSLHRTAHMPAQRGEAHRGVAHEGGAVSVHVLCARLDHSEAVVRRRDAGGLRYHGAYHGARMYMHVHGASHRGPGAPRYAVGRARPRLVRVRRTRCSRRASCPANPARIAHRRPVHVRTYPVARHGCGTPWLRVNTGGSLARVCRGRS